MKTRIDRQPFPSPRTRSHLEWARNFLLLTGVLALSYVGFALLEAKAYQSYATRRFDEARQSMRTPADIHESLNAPVSTSSGGTEVSLWEAESRGIAASPGVPLGRIEINAIGLSVMILEGTDARTLGLSVGHIPGTSMPGEAGNVAIAGHRDTFFRPLRRIRQNDEITLTTLKGSYLYRVDSTRVVEPEDTYVLDASDEAILTLVTCYPFDFVGSAPERFIVRAHRIIE